MEKQLIITKPGSISLEDKVKLEKVGNIVIEHENAMDIHFGNIFSYNHTCCSTCGDRIFMTEERFAALKKNGHIFYCSHGHTNAYPRKA